MVQIQGEKEDKEGMVLAKDGRMISAENIGDMADTVLSLQSQVLGI